MNLRVAGGLMKTGVVPPPLDNRESFGPSHFLQVTQAADRRLTGESSGSELVDLARGGR